MYSKKKLTYNYLKELRIRELHDRICYLEEFMESFIKIEFYTALRFHWSDYQECKRLHEAMVHELKNKQK